MNKVNVDIYADGCCKGNPGDGGWGFVVYSSGLETRECGGEKDTTNNRMELLSVIKALEFTLSSIGSSSNVTVYSDSRYVTSGVSSWLSKWISNGWRTSAGPVKNKDLWVRLLSLQESIDSVSFVWVKGHNISPGNNVADALANEGFRKLSS